MNKLAAIQDAVEEVNKEAYFGLIRPAIAAGKGLFSLGSRLFGGAASLGSKAVGAGRAVGSGLYGGAKSGAKGITDFSNRMPGTGIKGSIATGVAGAGVTAMADKNPLAIASRPKPYTGTY